MISGTIENDLGTIREALDRGLKVILLTHDSSAGMLERDYPGHVSNHILQIFDYAGDIALKILDGNIEGVEDDLKGLSEAVPRFNYEQFVVEHSRDRNIIITASAGTGKTSVMIDRILYLIDVEDVDPSEITMITFTNEATDQMMSRLQDVIITRFKLTHSVRYMELLEKSSRINISTIDSFSYRLLRTIGQNIGYSSNLSITSDALAVNDALLQILDGSYVQGHGVRECLGVNMYDAWALIRDFRSSLASLGIVGDDVKTLDWGMPLDEDSEKLQRMLIKGISGLEGYMRARRLEEDTVALSDLVLELSRALDSYEVVPDLGIRYLFVDEFQDTSDDQIGLVSDLAVRTGASLFVVGDPKQSIYRFRGADDSAFSTLERNLEEKGIHEIAWYSLVNNYRTDAFVLMDMNRRFRSWSKRKLLPRFDPLVPCKEGMGGQLVIKRIKKDNRECNLCRDLRAALNNSASRCKKGKTDDGKVVVLVRSNRQLDEVARICDANMIPMVTRRDRPLYTSEAVRDLHSMLSSYLYPDDPLALFGYLESAYSPKDIVLNVPELLDSNGDRSSILDQIYKALDSTEWGTYRSKFRNEPALSVIRDMLEDIPVLDNHVSRLKLQGIDDDDILEIKVREYKANLDKVLAILHSRFAGDGLDLHHMQEFLSVSIATNRDELEEELDFSDLNVAYCMTVHKAKGLEFDTVIIPFNRVLVSEPRTEILISSDRESVGWLYYKKGTIDLRNSLYGQIMEEDLARTEQEETRILYVAMTRAKRNLIAYTYWHGDMYCWSDLLEE